jgi:NAD-dependent deacetylase
MQSRFRLNQKTKLIVLTGAGISAESGIRTFRDSNGLWEDHSIDEVATPQALNRNPKLVWQFYKQRYENVCKVKPNDGHLALVKLEEYLQSNFVIITQNIDGLHQMAGNRNVIEMHGSINQCFCVDCRKRTKTDALDLSLDLPTCPHCGGLMRPDIVWFGEIPYHLEEIDVLIQHVDIFMVVGTSGVVYPAAQFVYVAKMRGADTISVNLEPPENVDLFDEFHQGRSGEVLPKLVEELIGHE